MKRTLLLIFILITGISIGMLVHNWQGQKKNNELPPQSSGTISEPTPKPQENNQTTARVLPILGTSNRLTAKQWQDMLAWRHQTEQLAAKESRLVYVNGPDQGKRVALTFDDGPDADVTPQVLNILNEYQVPATFFVTGNQVNKYRSLTKRIYDQGYLVESHAYSHQELSRMSRPDIAKELKATDQAIKVVIEVYPGLIRPPFGDVNEDVLNAVKDNEQRVIMWSIDTLDWSQQEPQHIADNVLNNVRPGEIILMHSRKGQEATVQALPTIIRGLREQGYEIVNVADLIGVQAYRN